GRPGTAVARVSLIKTAARPFWFPKSADRRGEVYAALQSRSRAAQRPRGEDGGLAGPGYCVPGGDGAASPGHHRGRAARPGGEPKWRPRLSAGRLASCWRTGPRQSVLTAISRRWRRAGPGTASGASSPSFRATPASAKSTNPEIRSTKSEIRNKPEGPNKKF